MLRLFRETFLGKDERRQSQEARSAPSARHAAPGKSALIFRAGLIVLQQSMLYLEFEDLNSMRLVCPHMKHILHQWCVTIARYLMKMVGPFNRMDPDPITAEMLADSTVPLHVMRRHLEKRLMIAHATGSFIFNITAIERGNFSRAINPLPPLESELGLMCNLLHVKAQGALKSSQLLALCGEDAHFKPSGGQTAHAYYPTGVGWKRICMAHSFLPHKDASRLTAVIHENHIYLAGGRALAVGSGHWETLGSFHRLAVSSFLANFVVHDHNQARNGRDGVDCASSATLWESLPSLISPRYGHSSVLYKNMLLIAGGNQDSRYLTSVEGYDFHEKKWIKYPDLLEPRFGFNMFVIEGKVYAAGGNASNSIDVFEDAADRQVLSAATDARSKDSSGSGSAAGDEEAGARDDSNEELVVAVAGSRWKEVTRLPEMYSALRSIGAITACMGHCIYFFGIDLAAADVQPSPSMNTLPDSLRWDCYNIRTSCWTRAEQESTNSSILDLFSRAVGWSTDVHRALPHSVRWGSAAAFPVCSL